MPRSKRKMKVVHVQNDKHKAIILRAIVFQPSSLLAEALFLVFADGRKETSAMGPKWLWFNDRPLSWTTLFEKHAPCVVRWLQLEPVASRALLYFNLRCHLFCTLQIFESGAQWKNTELFHPILPFVNGLPWFSLYVYSQATVLAYPFVPRRWEFAVSLAHCLALVEIFFRCLLVDER